MRYYQDLQQYLEILKEKGKLIRVNREINKDTQLEPFVRLQFRGLPEEHRTGFLFENVVDSRGRRFNIPVATSVVAGSRDIYAIGMMCQPEEIGDKWTEAQLHPIEPEIVGSGPIQDVVHMGETLLEHGGLDEFPIPISTPGFDVAPFITAPCWVTKDPETRIRNVGTYRAHVKSPTRTGMYCCTPKQGIGMHWRKCNAMGKPLEAAIIVGTTPNISYVAATKLPLDMDEFAVAGAVAKEPVKLVKCKTVDLEVPAYAEIVIEGELSTTESEPEAPFGEGMGYMGQREMMPYFTVKCITHRKNPIWQTMVCQLPPCEGSVICSIAWEHSMYKHLRYDLNMSHVLEIANHADLGNYHFSVIKMKNVEASEVWRTLEAAAEWIPLATKVVVAVDEDINSRDADRINSAITYRCQPHRDIRFHKLPATSLRDYSIVAPGSIALTKNLKYEDMPDSSLLFINALMKWPYPPVSLPKKEYMKEALRLWQEEGLPRLNLKEPWWGYELGYWPEEEKQEAAMATKGEYYKTGEKLARRRRPC